MREEGQLTAERPGIAAPRSRFSWRTIVLYALAAVFLSLVVWRSRMWEAADELDDVSLATLALVPLVSALLAVPLAQREREILLPLGYRFSAWSLAPIAYFGNTVGLMTPASSGELLRPTLFERGFGVPVSRGAAVVLFERLFSMLVFCVSLVFALLWTGGVVPLPAKVALTPILVATAFVPFAGVAVVGISLSRAVGFLPGFVRRWANGLDEAGEAFELLWRAPRLAVSFVALSALTFVVMAFQFWLVVESTGEHTSFSEAWVVLGTAGLVGMFSGLPFGLGAGDAVMISLLGVYGIDVVPAGAVVILTRCFINLPAGLMGLLAYIVALRRRPPLPTADLASADGVPVAIGHPRSRSG